MNVHEIRSCYPVTGDWYTVTRDHDESRWFIERVLLWALVSKDDEVDHIRGITGIGGMPHLSEPTWDVSLVYGPDASPIGKSWDEIYRATAPSMSMVREITELFEHEADE